MKKYFPILLSFLLITYNAYSTYSVVVHDIVANVHADTIVAGDVNINVTVVFSPQYLDINDSSENNAALILESIADAYEDYDYEDFEDEYNEEREGFKP